MDNFTKQLMVKLADGSFQGTLMPPGGDLSDPTALGRSLGQHVQQYPGYTPGTREFNQYIAQNKFSPEYGQGLYTLQQRMMGVAQSPEAVRGFASGQMPDMSSVYSGIGAEQFPGGSWASQGQGLLAKGLTYLPGAYGTAATAAMEAAKARARQGIQQGVMGSLDRNSPFVQRIMANAGTTYLSNKIDDWSRSLGGSWGHQLGGLGQFLLGVASKVPGYETLVNKGVDWFGPNLNQYFPATAGYQQPQQLPAPAQAAPAPKAPAPAQQPQQLPAPAQAAPAPKAPAPAQQPQKASSAYSHYRTVYQANGIEVLSPWNHR